MKETISNHPNYLEFTELIDETWLNYKFHLNDDRNRAVKLAVMLYHLPKINSNELIWKLVNLEGKLTVSFAEFQKLEINIHVLN